MEEKLVSFRLNSSDYEALRKLAKREVRSMSGWLKFRVLEAIRAGLISTEDTHQNESRHSIAEQKKKESRGGNDQWKRN